MQTLPTGESPDLRPHPGRHPDPAETALAIDTETTGLNFKIPDTHFDNPDKYFDTPARPFIVTACDTNGNQYIWQWDVDPHTRRVKIQYGTDPQLRKIQQLASRYAVLVFHNAKFDLHALASVGLDFSDRLHRHGKTLPTIHDTLASAHVLDSVESHKLKTLSIKYLDILDTDEDILRQKVKEARAHAKTHGIPRGPCVASDYFLPKALFNSDVAATYAATDTVRTILLYLLHRTELTRQSLTDNYYRELDVLAATYIMETAGGIRIRPRVFSSERRRCNREHTTRYRDLQAQLQIWPNFNPDSYKQLSSALYGAFNLPVIQKTAKGQPSTDKFCINLLANATADITHVGTVRKAWRNLGFSCDSKGRMKRDQHHRMKKAAKFLESLLTYRSYSTAATYLNTYHKYQTSTAHVFNWIWANFNIWGTSTTRFSSSEPNMQNVGKESFVPLRNVFGPDSSHLWIAIDYNQVELRLMASASQDPTLLKILRDGLDRHQITADGLDIPRKQGKAINFAWQYGAGESKLSLMAGISAEDFLEAMRDTYPLVVAFMEKTIAQVKRRHRHEGFGYVKTLFGYRLSVPVNKAYIGTNSIIQGTAGDILKNSLIAATRYLQKNEIPPTDIRIVLTIHDEMVFEVRKTFDYTPHMIAIRDIMAAAGDPIGCPTPVEVSTITSSWAKPRRSIRLNQPSRSLT